MMFDTDKLTPFHRERLAMIEEEDYSGVRRKARELCDGWLTESDLDHGIESLKAYYGVALLDPLNEHAVDPIIDVFWHAHILHTRQYAEFCERVFGQFLHHDPLDHQDVNEVREVRDLYDYTAKVYRMLGAPEGLQYNDVPDSLLVCRHHFVHTAEVREHALLAARV
jgi:hypothetical protein